MEDGRLMLDPNSEYKLGQVHPWLAHLIRVMHDKLFACGIPVMVVQGLRAWADQEKLWLIGRDKDGNVIDKAKVVTNAPPGHSYHNFGLAVDVVPTAFVHLADWGTGRTEWQYVVAAGERLGLFSGSHFTHPKPDWPHFQLTGKFPESPNDEMRELFKDGGLNAVWKAANIETQS